ncbi:PPPDE putative peptidase domain [Carpediemonas membranifera]|uniref:PPPDE putative peptidase domain n=1 Tax=Carpediemonas membranifera TaxID=201153 RepID=A0A8J6E3J4_9EUKA|nr:PPPDE putative peptidase domain [Carpediemonas membranifera]|eukprot:KAG9393262.1 PPPDE putative peptidase domain [Carpediemonas membranifera]
MQAMASRAEVDPRDVFLNVYDLSPMNALMAPIGLGIHHTGLEVHGEEWYFAGHYNNTSGIFKCAPRTCALENGDAHFRRSIYLGRTFRRWSEVTQIIADLGDTFVGLSYSVLSFNCNDFTLALARRLLPDGLKFPRGTNRMARVGEFFLSKLPESTQEMCQQALIGEEFPRLLKPKAEVKARLVSPTGSKTGSTKSRTKTKDDAWGAHPRRACELN